MRESRPLGYVGLLTTFGLPWALANVIASGRVAGQYRVAERDGVCPRRRGADGRSGRARGPGSLRDLWLLPLRDIVALGVWFWSFANDRVIWRGERFLLHGGKLIRVKK